MVMTGRPIPLAVAGAGRVAHAVHLRVARDLPDEFQLVAILETDPAQAAATRRAYPGVCVGPALDTAIRAGARAVLCATPWHTHAEVAAQALSAGLPVLCEKPVTLDPGEIGLLMECERRSGGRFAAGYMKRHDPAVCAFLDHVRKADGLCALIVTVIDPNAGHQVQHLLPAGVRGPGAATRQAGQRRLEDLWPGLTAIQRTVYAHGMGGSLIHHINLVHALLGRNLTGSLTHAVTWADGTGVSCGWRPAPGQAVLMTHQRAPGHGEYREDVQAVCGDSHILLTLPSPYARDQGGVVEVRRWDRQGTLLTRWHGPAGETGFVRQLRNWAAWIRGVPGAFMPGLAEALADVTAVQEAIGSLNSDKPTVPSAEGG
jgi:predicted dehydrogenase